MIQDLEEIIVYNLKKIIVDIMKNVMYHIKKKKQIVKENVQIQNRKQIQMHIIIDLDRIQNVNVMKI